MRTIVHISDLHFGRIDPAILEPLTRTTQHLQPDLVAISGDLTQRARIQEFQEASTYLQKLPLPQIVVPGNHDIPLYNLFDRFTQPLMRYRRFITNDLYPFYQDPEVAVLGINTARSLTTKYGRINHQQIDQINRHFSSLEDSVVKIVVTHHPFDLPEGARQSDLVRRAELAMLALAQNKVDLLLAGHMHRAMSGHTAERYRIEGFSAIFVQAGTATSVRGRGEPNSLNVLRIAFPNITIERLGWSAEKGLFTSNSIQRYTCGEQGWEPEPIDQDSPKV
jgi:3',5'-cyclic AMP phosphodiesterase CpdA